MPKINMAHGSHKNFDRSEWAPISLGLTYKSFPRLHSAHLSDFDSYFFIAFIESKLINPRQHFFLSLYSSSFF